MKYDKITIERISKMHPSLREKIEQDYIECNNSVLGAGVRLRFSQSYRSISEQDALYAQGRTKPGNIVTNARGGQSYHNYGLAFDMVLLIDTDGNGTFETASWDRLKDLDKDKKSDWMEVVDFFKSKGWQWGGDFKSFKDYPHFQLTYGNSIADLKAMDIDDDGYVIL